MILSPSIGTLHHSLCLLKDNEASSLILCQASRAQTNLDFQGSNIR